MTSRYQFILRRLALTVFTLWVIITFLFVMFRVMPGNPAAHVVSPTFTAAEQEALLAQHGLDRPLHEQYVIYLVNFMQGDLGRSFSHGGPVLPFLLDRTLNTIVITVPAVIMAFIAGPFIGAKFAWDRGSRLDDYGTAGILFMYAAPIFWTGMLAIMIFSFWLGWLPSGGMREATYLEESLLGRFAAWDFVLHAIMPLSIFALWWLSIPVLIMRNNLADVLQTDYIALKRAEGIPPRRLKYRHAMKNAMLPVVHYGALAIGFAFGGSVILETVFSWPGLGREMWRAVLANDYPIAQGAFFILAFMIILFNLLADILSVYIDPRVADEGKM